MPKVSIIIPCYNKAEHVAQTLESCLSQTYNNLEIIIVNDGSNDNSSQIIKSYADKHKHVLFFDKTTNDGVIKTRNFAIEASRGEYILPVDADDTIDSTYVEKAVKILDEHKDIGVVYCKAKFFGDKNGNLNCPEFSEDYLLYSSCISACSMFRKKDFEKCGGYRDYMEFGCEDWDLWLHFYENGFKFYRIPEELLNYRKSDNNHSRTSSQRENQETLWKLLVKNHLDLYLNNENFINKIFKKTKEPLKNANKNIKKISYIVWAILAFELVQILLFCLYIFTSKGA